MGIFSSAFETFYGTLIEMGKRSSQPIPVAPFTITRNGLQGNSETELVEEENYKEFKTGNYCPVDIGDVCASNTYQILGKLGFGSTSTVWLARNLQYADSMCTRRSLSKS
jgi:hypothetical protein